MKKLNFERPPISEDWQIVYLKSSQLKEIWNKNPITAEVQQWTGETHRAWFNDASKTRLVVGRAYYDDEGITFINGRHRTRYLLGLGLTEIPVCMKSNSILNAKHDGLLSLQE